jgi:DNA-binding response OmpR family regulator
MTTQDAHAHPYTVAIVEDESVLREEMAFQLQHLGFEVLTFESAPSFYRFMASRRNTVAVLDIGLSGENGLQICQYLREHDAQMGIIFLTARGARHDRLIGLEAGADAYPVKPVDMDELTLLIRRLGQRYVGRPSAGAAPADARRPRAPGWQFQDDTLTLLPPSGQPLRLTLTEWQLLRALAVRQGQVCSRAELGRALNMLPDEWDPHRLEVIISRLRTKASLQSGLELPLRTLRGVGYVWTGGEKDSDSP